ncbi:MAG TPA: type II secretion system protein N [Gammaproteobacteria bacterium]|nr:type II secretion system protein N [Gammaproteobacteria bacterium]
MTFNLNKAPSLNSSLHLGFGLLCLLTLGLGLNTWVSDWALIHQAPMVAAIPHENSNTLQKHIADAHLFGRNLSADGDVPVTNLDCRVTGITKIFNEHGSDVSHATISIAGAPDKRYQVGDALPDGVKIVGIESNAVILENDGRLEKLPLPRTTLVFQPRSSSGIFQ